MWKDVGMAGVKAGMRLLELLWFYEHSVLLFMDTLSLTYDEFQFQDGVATIHGKIDMDS